MQQLDSYLADRALTRQLYLMRFTAGEQKKVLAVLTQMQKELRLKLLNDLTDFSKARVNKLLSESTAIIEAAYKEMAPAFKGEYRWLVDSSGKVLDFSAKGDVTKFVQNVEIDIGKQLGKHVIDIHTHPDLSYPSPEDWSMLSFGHTEKVRVILKDGTVLELTKPASVRMTPKSIKEKWQAIENEIFESGRSDKMTVEAIIQEINERLVKETGVKLTVSRLKDFKGEDWAKDAAMKIGGGGKSTDLLGLAKAEAAATQTAIASIGLEASLPSAAVLKAMVSDTLLQGAPLSEWWKKQSQDTAFKFSAQVRQGVAQGETLQQVITRIVGSKKKGIVGIMEISHRHASTLVHDSIMQIANDARMATYKANADIMKGFEWLATLDGNTCVQCMAYSGAQWDMEGKPIKGDLPLKNPPLHPNCRCVLTPLTKSYRELGLNIDEMPPGTRASDLGPVPADMTMDAFLKRHDTEYLNDLLGPGRA